MQILFSFSFNTDTKEAAMAGNIPAPQALTILTQLCIANGIEKASSQKETKGVDIDHSKGTQAPESV